MWCLQCQLFWPSMTCIPIQSSALFKTWLIKLHKLSYHCYWPQMHSTISLSPPPMVDIWYFCLGCTWDRTRCFLWLFSFHLHRSDIFGGSRNRSSNLAGVYHLEEGFSPDRWKRRKLLGNLKPEMGGAEISDHFLQRSLSFDVLKFKTTTNAGSFQAKIAMRYRIWLWFPFICAHLWLHMLLLGTLKPLQGISDFIKAAGICRTLLLCFNGRHTSEVQQASWTRTGTSSRPSGEPHMMAMGSV